MFRQEFDLPAEEEERMEVSLTITDEETIRQINREYRDIDRVTDVLSFPQYESAEAVAEELKSLDEEISVLLEYGNTEERELTYLFVHSMMHLLGYDHMEEEEKKVMRLHEENVMSAVDLKRE